MMGNKSKSINKKNNTALWLNGKLSEAQLKKVLSREEIKDIEFGKRWIEEAISEIEGNDVINKRKLEIESGEVEYASEDDYYQYLSKRCNVGKILKTQAKNQ